MPDIIHTIKRAALDAVRASKPCEIAYGTVLETSPFTVQVDQKIKLSGDMVVLLETYNSDMTTGDKIVLLRVQGGQKYICLGKVAQK